MDFNHCKSQYQKKNVTCSIRNEINQLTFSENHQVFDKSESDTVLSKTQGAHGFSSFSARLSEVISCTLLFFPVLVAR